MRNRFLFLYRRREAYGADGSLASGLRNSSRFLSDMLLGLGITSKAVEVIDNNCIDREVSDFRPTHVVIEAFWVVPEKFDVLMPLHPHVRWIVRNHSETPFLAQEGIALEWVAGYLKRNIELQCNSRRSYHDMRMLAHSLGFSEHLVTYMPNFYPHPSAVVRRHAAWDGVLHIGCFGAIRPLKNQLSQAIAAMAFADELRVNLCFHINASRVEGQGDPALKNLRAAFAASPRHKLVEEQWVPHDEFLTIVARMDLAMQVSLSETFNIVSADAVSCGVPIVASPEVAWLGAYAMAQPNDTRSMVSGLWEAWETPKPLRLSAQRRDLVAFSTASEQAWAARFKDAA